MINRKLFLFLIMEEIVFGLLKINLYVSQAKQIEAENEKIRINEILPNPIGSDKEGEFIELYNPSKESIDLSDWIIKYKRYYIYKNKKRSLLKISVIKKDKRYIIPPQGYLIIKRKDTHCFRRKEFVETGFDRYVCGMFNLYNSGKIEIQLLNPKKEKIFQLNYNLNSYFQRWMEEVSLNYFQGSEHWSKYVTKNQRNKLDKFPAINFLVPQKNYLNVFTHFSVKGKNLKNKIKKVIWDFGDGHRSYLLKTKHKYQVVGRYKVKLILFNGSEIVEKNFFITIKKFPRYKVKIRGVLPNPIGKDKNKEYLLIYNKTHKKINLKNWSVATGLQKNKLVNHPIYKDFIIKPYHMRKLTGKYFHFILTNRKMIVELRYPDGKIASRVHYKFKNGKKNIPEGMIFLKKKGSRWNWKIIDKKRETKDEKNISNNIGSEIKSLNDNNLNLIKKTNIFNYNNNKITNLIKIEESQINYLENENQNNDVLIKKSREVKGAQIIVQNNFKKVLFESNQNINLNLTENKKLSQIYINEREGKIYYNPEIQSDNYWRHFFQKIKVLTNYIL